MRCPPIPIAGPMQIVEVAQLAERLGFDAVWTIELTTPSTSMQIPDGEVPRWYEVLTTLAYVAARTERIALGTGVLVLPNRDPILLAKQVATLDVFSKGRVILGVGVGKYRDEFVSLHPRLANVRRAGMLEEGLECLRRASPENTTSFTTFPSIPGHGKTRCRSTWPGYTRTRPVGWPAGVLGG